MDTISVANGGVTSCSTTSEGCCAAIQAACQILVERLTPLYQQLQAAAQDGEVTWETLISKAICMIDLKVHHRYAPKQSLSLNYAAAASEVEINILTGETQILAADLVFDCGKSLNPAVDMGQIEGAFVQGFGFYVTEGVEMEDGRELADGTWGYKVPTVDTIPQRFHIELFYSPALQERVLSSKASGEAPFLLAGSVHSAIRRAILSARKESTKWTSDSSLGDHDSGVDDFILNPPASMDRIKKLCGFDNVKSYVAFMASNAQDSTSVLQCGR